MDLLSLQSSVGYGPGFLWKPESEWPHQPLTVSEVLDDDPEVKGTTVPSSNAVIIDQSCGATNKLINHFSDWHQLRRAVAVFLQVKRTLQIRCKERVNVKDGVSRNLAGQGTPQPPKQLSVRTSKELVGLSQCKT